MQAVLITSLSHMHLSGDAKIYYIGAQTDWSLVWLYFPQINVSGKQNQSQKVVKRGMYRMRRP